MNVFQVQVCAEVKKTAACYYVKNGISFLQKKLTCHNHQRIDCGFFVLKNTVL